MKLQLQSVLLLVMAFCLSAGCGGAEKPDRIEDLPLAGEVALAGLEEAVEVVFDDRGMPHIYAGSIHDAVMLQGYLMARDRMTQLEFYRRVVSGRLSEVAYSVFPELLEMDIGARFVGFRRIAQATYDALPPGDGNREALGAFAEGVNCVIAKLRDGTLTLPGGLGNLLRAELIEDWSPVDTLAIARYMFHLLSSSAELEVSLTEARVAVAQEFPENSPDPKLAARSKLLHDLWPFAPAEPVFSRGGLLGGAGWTAPGPLFPRPSLSRELLARSRRFLERTGLRAYAAWGPDVGSNNWVVHGSKTASGYPILANDPHLSLDSPPQYWYVHLNTRRAGGELDAQGLALAGAPGVVHGYNPHIAWGQTTAPYDVEDVYLETITPGAGGPDTVLYRGQAVPIEKIQEVIRRNTGGEVVVEFERVPHHGLIIPDSRTQTQGVSTRWQGNQPSNEAKTILGLMLATNLEEVRQALSHYEVGAQNFVVVTRAGDIFWTSPALIPVRQAAALTYDPATDQGDAPCFLLPGTGDFEWTGEYLADADLPQDLNPAKGFIATANNDPVGVTADGSPANDAVYLGYNFDLGHRIARITSRLDALTSRSGITPEEMSALQGDDFSPLGSKLSSALVDAVDRAAEERASPGSHPDLTAIVAEAGERLGRLVEMRDRLAGWTSFGTPAAVEGRPAQDEIEDSVAASIFNVALHRLVLLAFQDEVDRVGVRPYDRWIAKTLQWAVLDPARLGTYDSLANDTVLWDDLGTAGVTETRNERMVRALLETLDWLEVRLGAEMDGWRWGKLHTVRFETIIPRFDAFSIPPPGDSRFPDGFPRHGDTFGVDASAPPIWEPEVFGYRHGPQQRLVAEMTPDGPRAWNAIPGGQQHDPEGPHHADEAEYWRKNQAPPMYFTERDVVRAAEQRLRFVP